uniref:Uncharacterized protein n=1 Tax=Anguilla anguilla TaxID=7936 RepID=A0A0E9TGB4_ANGAN
MFTVALYRHVMLRTASFFVNVVCFRLGFACLWLGGLCKMIVRFLECGRGEEFRMTMCGIKIVFPIQMGKAI